MSTDYDELNVYNTEHYVLEWKSSTSPPQAEAIEIIELQSYEEKEENWASFKYLTGDHLGCISGAPKNRIFTKAESTEVFQVLAAAKASLLRKKDLQEGVTASKSGLLNNLSKEERELL